jgi:hypothetical protein
MKQKNVSYREDQNMMVGVVVCSNKESKIVTVGPPKLIDEMFVNVMGEYVFLKR